MKIKAMKFILCILSLAFIFACSDDEDKDTELTEVLSDNSDYSDWSDATHSKSGELDYDVVFNQTEVLHFDIEISNDNWALMQADLVANLGGSTGGPGGGGPGGGFAETDFDPIWVPCSFNFNNTEWYQVGIRFKGNSSLMSAYKSGNNKLSFKLDFDEFEDEYPILKNQRFYGFKQLNLNNNFDDASFVREKVTSDLFRKFGLVSAQTAFCVVYINHDDESQYFGLYTLVEEVDNSVIETQLGDDSGNIYKPDGDAASFAYGTYDDGEMEKKNNEDDANYSDVQALYNIINDDSRTINNTQWKTDIEAVLDVDGFMKWLAANTVIQNWDTYGNMTHNYYLYNSHLSNKLIWIPWDNNEALQEGKQDGALSLSMSEVNSSWPLINYLRNEPEYEQLYNNYLGSFVNNVFVANNLSVLYDNYYQMLKDYAYSEQDGYTYLWSDGDFDSAIDQLKDHAQTRTDATLQYLNSK